jgi:hypothetical protein
VGREFSGEADEDGKADDDSADLFHESHHNNTDGLILIVF